MKETAHMTALDMSVLEGYPGLMTAEHVREVLGIGRTGIYELLKSGEIPSLMIRGKYRVPKQYLLEYLNQNTCRVVQESVY